MSSDPLTRVFNAPPASLVKQYFAPVAAALSIHQSSRWIFLHSAFHGPIDSAAGAHRLLEKKPGAFLIRQAALRISDQNIHGAVLSIVTKHGIVHKSLTSVMDESAMLSLVRKETECTATPISSVIKKGPLVPARCGSFDSALMPASVRIKICFEKTLDHATARGITVPELFERCIPRTVATNFLEQAFVDSSHWSATQFAMYQEAFNTWTLFGTASAENPQASLHKSPVGSAVLCPMQTDPKSFELFVNQRDMMTCVASPVCFGVVVLKPGETTSDAMARLHPKLFPVKPRKDAVSLEALKKAYEDPLKHLGQGSSGEVRACMLGGETIAIKASKPTRILIKKHGVASDTSDFGVNDVALASEMLAWELVASSKLHGIPRVALVSDYAIENTANIASRDEKLSPTVYMVMPLLRNGTHTWTAGLTPLEAAELGRAVCSTLARMHARGLSHRDVKPENVGKDGTLIDFGFVFDEATAQSATKQLHRAAKESKVKVLTSSYALDFKPKGLPGSGGYSSSRRLSGALQVSEIPCEDIFAVAMTLAQISCCFNDSFIKKYGKFHNPIFAYAHAAGSRSPDGHLDWNKATRQFTPEFFTSYLKETMTDGVGKDELIALLARAVNDDVGVVPTALEMSRELTRLLAVYS